MDSRFCLMPNSQDHLEESIAAKAQMFAKTFHWDAKTVATMIGMLAMGKVKTIAAELRKNDATLTQKEAEEQAIEKSIDSVRSQLASLADYRAYQLLSSMWENHLQSRQKEIFSTQENTENLWRGASIFFNDESGKFGGEQAVEHFYERIDLVAKYFMDALASIRENIKKNPGKYGTKGIENMSDTALLNGIPATDIQGNIVRNADGSVKYILNSEVIFGMVYQRIARDYNIMMNDKFLSQATKEFRKSEYEKMLGKQGWPALVLFARKRLNTFHRVDVGISGKVDTAFSEFLSSNDLLDIYNGEETVRDGWQIIKEYETSFNACSPVVRQLLARSILKEYSNQFLQWFDATDSLGNVKTLNSVSAYANLQRELSVFKSKTKMIRYLESKPKYAGLVAELKKDPYLQTAFFVNFNRDETLYAKLMNKATKFIFKAMNIVGASRKAKQYFAKIQSGHGGILAKSYYSFTDDTVDALNKVFARNEINGVVEGISGRFSDWQTALPVNIVAALETLDIKIPDGLVSVLNTNNALKQRLYEDLVAIRNSIFKNGKLKKYASVEEILNEMTKGKPVFKDRLKSIINTLDTAFPDLQFEPVCRTVNEKGKKVTMSSYIEPSYMGTFVTKIRSFVTSAEEGGMKQQVARAGLRNFLAQEFFKSSIFVDINKTQGKNPEVEVTVDDKGNITATCSVIRNAWLRQLYIEANYDKIIDNAKLIYNNNPNPLNIKSVKDIFDKDSFTRNFSLTRLLTMEDTNGKVTNFKNFSRSDHFKSLLTAFFSKDELRSTIDNFGLFPIFILGDANVSKYMTASRFYTKEDYIVNNGKFNADKILDELYEVFQSECRRMTLFKHIAKEEDERIAKDICFTVTGKLWSNLSEKQKEDLRFKYSNINIHKNQNKFTMLLFLNDEISDDNTVDQIIKHYSEGGGIGKANFKTSANKYLETLFGNISQYAKANNVIISDPKLNLALDIKDDDNSKISITAEERLKEFIYSTYLGNLLQFQIFTIDCGLYDNVKDFQKRYKEEHAPGMSLDIEAVWKGKRLYDDMQGRPALEKAVYFHEKTISTEKVNKELAETLILVHTDRLKDPSISPKEKEAIRAQIIEEFKDCGLTNKNGNSFGLCEMQENAEDEEARLAKVKEVIGERGFKIYKKFLKNARTDGQTWRGMTGYRNVGIMAGIWTDRLEALYTRVMQVCEQCFRSNTIPSERALQEIESFKESIMSIKPYYFGFEKVPITDPNNKSKILEYLPIAVQHKCSEQILIPCLLPVGSPLRDLAYWMEGYRMDENGMPIDGRDFDNIIDIVTTDKSVKVGMFGQTELSDTTEGDFAEVVTQTDSNGNVTSRSQTAHVNNLVYKSLSKAYVHKLPYEHYRIQGSVKNHADAARRLGTQITRLIMSKNPEIASNVLNYFKDKNGSAVTKIKITGNESKAIELNENSMSQLYNALLSSLYMESFENFADILNNPKKLSRMLSQAVLNNDRMGLFRLEDFMLTDTKDGISSNLYDGNVVFDVEGFLTALFSNMVNKLMTEGGSLVQASEWGTTIKEAGKERPLKFKIKDHNVVYAEVEVPFQESFRDHNGNRIHLNFFTYCEPDGTLKVVKDEDGNVVTRVDPDTGETIPLTKIEQDFPGILDIIAYRVPSEREYSMLNCRIVRFTPPTAGGTIRVPADAVTIAGFDFDIDKLYFLKREFSGSYNIKYNEFTDEQKNAIFAEIYTKYPKIRTQLKDIRDEKHNIVDVVIEDDTKYYIIDNGDDTTKKVSSDDYRLPALNSFWNELIERNPDKKEAWNKDDLFAEVLKENPNKYPKHLELTYNPNRYNFNVGVFDNSRAARKNLIFEMMKQRLMDPATLEGRLTPGAFDNSGDSAVTLQKLLRCSKIKSNTDNITSIYQLITNVDGKYSIDLDKVEKLVEFEEENLDPADIYTNIYFNALNQIADKLIGVFANQNGNHQISSRLLKLTLSDSIIFGRLGNAKILSNVGAKEENELGKTLLGKKIKYTYTDAAGKDHIKIINTDITMAEFLAAAVDAVKNPVLNYLNFNEFTAAPGCVLARLGYDTTDIGVLFNQPIIKELCSLFAENKNSYKFDQFYKRLLRKYAPETKLNDADLNISTEELAAALVKSRQFEQDSNILPNLINNDRQFSKTQAIALEIFKKAFVAGKDLTTFVSDTKQTASNSVSSTFGGMYSEIIKRNRNNNQAYTKLNCATHKDSNDQEVNRPLNLESLFNPKEVTKKASWKKKKQYKRDYLESIISNPVAGEQCMYDLKRAFLKLAEKWFPYESELYTSFRDAVHEIVGTDNTLKDDIINNCHRETLQHHLTQDMYSIFKWDAPCADSIPLGQPLDTSKMMNNRDFYLYEFPKIFNIYRQSLNAPIPIDAQGDIIKVLTSNGEKFYSVINLTVNFYDYTSQELTGYWKALAEGNEFEQRLARGLYMYCYYKKGFTSGTFNFMQYVPDVVKKLLTVNDGGVLRDYKTFTTLNKLKDRKSSEQEAKEFATMFALNHPEEWSLVKPFPNVEFLGYYENNPKAKAARNTLFQDLFTPIDKNRMGRKATHIMVSVSKNSIHSLRSAYEYTDENGILHTASIDLNAEAESLVGSNAQKILEDINKAFITNVDKEKDGASGRLRIKLYSVIPIFMAEDGETAFVAHVRSQNGMETIGATANVEENEVIVYKRMPILGNTESNCYARTLDEAIQRSTDKYSYFERLNKDTSLRTFADVWFNNSYKFALTNYSDNVHNISESMMGNLRELKFVRLELMSTDENIINEPTKYIELKDMILYPWLAADSLLGLAHRYFSGTYNMLLNNEKLSQKDIKAASQDMANFNKCVNFFNFLSPKIKMVVDAVNRQMAFHQTVSTDSFILSDEVQTLFNNIIQTIELSTGLKMKVIKAEPFPEMPLLYMLQLEESIDNFSNFYKYIEKINLIPSYNGLGLFQSLLGRLHSNNYITLYLEDNKAKGDVNITDFLGLPKKLSEITSPASWAQAEIRNIQLIKESFHDFFGIDIKIKQNSDGELQYVVSEEEAARVAEILYLMTDLKYSIDVDDLVVNEDEIAESLEECAIASTETMNSFLDEIMHMDNVEISDAIGAKQIVSDLSASKADKAKAVAKVIADAVSKGNKEVYTLYGERFC